MVSIEPDYSPHVLQKLLDMIPGNHLSVADIGAGTGILDSLLNTKKIKELYAVEPSLNMLKQGQNHAQNGNIKWISGSAEKSNLDSDSFDIITMASSFHWADFDQATMEFHRVLEKGGLFCALESKTY